MVDLAEAAARPAVFFFYPRTGEPGKAAGPEWDAIPGARGCTPQSCGFRDLHREFMTLGVRRLRHQHAGDRLPARVRRAQPRALRAPERPRSAAHPRAPPADLRVPGGAGRADDLDQAHGVVRRAGADREDLVSGLSAGPECRDGARVAPRARARARASGAERSSWHEDRRPGPAGGFQPPPEVARPDRRGVRRGAHAAPARGRGRVDHAGGREHHAAQAHGRLGLRARAREVPRGRAAHLRDLRRDDPARPRGAEPRPVLAGLHRSHRRAQCLRPPEGVVRGGGLGRSGGRAGARSRWSSSGRPGSVAWAPRSRRWPSTGTNA